MAEPLVFDDPKDIPGEITHPEARMPARDVLELKYRGHIEINITNHDNVKLLAA